MGGGGNGERMGKGRSVYEKGEWGLALSSAAQGSPIDIVGASFFPPALQGCVADDFLSVTIATGVGRAAIDDHCSAEGNNNSKMQGCGIWVLTAFWGTLFQLAISPFSWVDAAMEGVGVRVGQMMETEAAREPEEGEARKKSMSLEDLRRKYSWWPSSHGKEGSSDPLRSMKTEAEEGAALKMGKTTRL